LRCRKRSKKKSHIEISTGYSCQVEDPPDLRFYFSLITDGKEKLQKKPEKAYPADISKPFRIRRMAVMVELITTCRHEILVLLIQIINNSCYFSASISGYSINMIISSSKYF